MTPVRDTTTRPADGWGIAAVLLAVGAGRPRENARDERGAA
jgi:hypothetical protein